MIDADQVLKKAAAGKRIGRGEALEISSSRDVTFIHRLGETARKIKTGRFGKKATYVINYAVNPSNVCSSDCKFCHYHANEGDPSAYTMKKEEILEGLEKLKPTEVHITGGLNDSWNFANSLELIGDVRNKYPAIFIKAFTAVEIDHFAKKENTTALTILEKLREAGLDSLTGGGAEIFSARLRQKYCPDKIGPETWLDIHAAAHGIGVGSNATMLYGLDETDEEVVDHLIALREAQDRSGGFSCFIPLAYQPEKGNPSDKGPSALENIRMIALSRVLLDNFDHIKAYWPMIGLDTAAVGLTFGADDLDGTLGRERIAHSGDSKTPEFLTRNLMEETILASGSEPVERDGKFQPVKQAGAL